MISVERLAHNIARVGGLRPEVYASSSYLHWRGIPLGYFDDATIAVLTSRPVATVAQARRRRALAAARSAARRLFR